ncbi:MAG: CaiB/BaiF CoA transferase family protein [Candidatus Binataceae bacterium]
MSRKAARPGASLASYNVEGVRDAKMPPELLSGFRMLDLADDKGALCGRIFADMGAEVIKVEPLSGCPTRAIPPFLDDRPSAERSLYSLAYNAGKLSITANLESADARAILVELAKKSDFFVESYPAGYLDSRGLGYTSLSAINPRLIYVSIAPFGESGPARDYQARDIVSWAAGGAMFMMGDEGRPPLEMSLPQAGLHAGAEAAVGALLAHYPRQIDGRGQRVIVDMQACVAWTLMNEQAMPIMHGDYIRRGGVYYTATGSRRKMVFRCKDGHISLMLVGGFGVGARSIKGLIGWMAENGSAADWMLKKDWASWTPGLISRATAKDHEEIADLENRVETFFLRMTKREIYARGRELRILLAPVATAADIAADEQLKARGYFVSVRHKAVDRTLTLPGPFAKFSQTPLKSPRPAPQLGEHNHDIYCGLLNLSEERLGQLAASGAI